MTAKKHPARKLSRQKLEQDTAAYYDSLIPEDAVLGRISRKPLYL